MQSTVLALFLGLLSLGSAAAAHSTEVANSTSGSTGSSFNTIESLYRGNQRFQGAASRKREAVSRLVEAPPSFMFLGCTDNRLTPASIFQAPMGSVIAQNNIGNQYSKKDVSTNAAITYAIEDLGVQHIIVLGHYGCSALKKAVVASRTKTMDSPVLKWIKPVVDFYKIARRREIVKFRDSRMPQRGKPEGVTDVPKSDEEGLRALVEENVKNTVKGLKNHSLLAKAYQVNAKTRLTKSSVEVYVHGFVFDEETGGVVNMNVSFGPPGKPIPSIPFTAVAAAKNFHRQKHLPGINKGKNLPGK
ncbi:carbonic anhydrase [Coprinopsis sp. MPI-PUGE-AT-0042]|nr:carbonic anhydrase [Coprinopsis sp. MPI-PUGE-AT-0042]